MGSRSKGKELNIHRQGALYIQQCSKIASIHQCRCEQTFGKKPNSQYFWLCGSYSFYCDYSSLPLCRGSSHRKYVNNSTGLSSNKTLYKSRQCGHDWMQGCSLPTPSAGCVKRSEVVQWFSTYNIWAQVEWVIAFQTICESFWWCQGELLNCDQKAFSMSLTLEDFWLQQG